MKKRYQLVISILLSLFLVALCLLIFYAKNSEDLRNTIGTREEATIIGKAYLQIKYPEMNFDDCYTYFAYKDDEVWVVWCTSNEADNAEKLPGVVFKADGEFVRTGLPKD